MADAAARPIDRAMAAYLALATIALAFPQRAGLWPLLLLMALAPQVWRWLA